MGWSLVQNAGADSTNGAGVSSFAVAFGSNVTAGNLLVVGVGSHNAITGVTDTQGNVYQAAIFAQSTVSTGVFFTLASSTGANTVTVHGSSCFPGMGIA